MENVPIIQLKRLEAKSAIQDNSFLLISHANNFHGKCLSFAATYFIEAIYIAFQLTRVTLDGIQRVKIPNKTIYKINIQKHSLPKGNIQKKISVFYFYFVRFRYWKTSAIYCNLVSSFPNLYDKTSDRTRAQHPFSTSISQ